VASDSALRLPVVFALIAAALVAFNLPHLTDPPYWDAVTGVYTQGVWLQQNGFDFMRLAQEPDYVHGGPNYNVLLLHAPLFAALGLALPPKGVFLVLHLLNLGLSALALTCGFAMLRRRLPTALAGLWMLAAACNPVWSGQTAAIYLEVPVAAAVCVSLWWFSQGRTRAAALACIVGYFVKDSILILATAYATFAVVAAGLQRWTRGAAHAIAPRDGIALVAPLVLLLGLTMVSATYLEASWDFPAQTADLFGKGKILFPDLMLVTGVAGLLFAVRVFDWVSGRLDWREDRDLPLLLLLAILTGGFWAAMVSYFHPLVRYTTFILIPLLVGVGLMLARHRRTSLGLAAGLALFGAVNQHGALLGRVPFHASRSGHYLERSREFLKDLRGNQAICARLESEFASVPIVTKYPFTQMLRRPEFGYVGEPLEDVVVMGRIPLIARANPYRPDRPLPPETLYIFSPNIFEATWKPSLQPRESDERVMVETGGLSEPVVVYRRSADEGGRASGSPP